MSRRRASRLLKQQLARPPAELGMATRVLFWVFRNDVSSAAAIGVLVVLAKSIEFAVTARAELDVLHLLRGIVTMLILGVFFGVVVVTEDAKEYRASGARIRMTCGAIAFAAVAHVFAASGAAVFVAAVAGALIGYFGSYWARNL